MNKKTQLAVIGGGHAGIEAALAAARMGISTTLFTLSLDTVANMPCNPSIGGTAKGHLVYEIDALGGEMGRAADAVTLQSRTLNLGKGAAVHSKRIQADRVKYSAHIKHILEKTENLRPLQAEIVEILTTDMGNGEQRISGVVTSLGEVFECDAAIIASGTYLEGRIFVGDRTAEAGPDGMLPSRGLSASLAAAGLSMRRFKTGTPPRILRSSVDFSRLEEQAGEPSPIPFSADTDEAAMADREQIPCHIVYTNAETHRIIKENISRSALFSGLISGVGPRYCPSIEDKIYRFADKERHQLFLEPMGEATDEMYLQGFSTSLPPDVQEEMLHTLTGFEHAVISRYAYAIEYDCVDPTELYPTLEHKKIRYLYGAGQFNGTSGYEEAAAQGLVAGINAALKLKGEEPLVLKRSDGYVGTSGYEEAAAQGLVAGINAALKLKGEEPLVLKRSDGYVGTLIDDLVTKGTNEPYRMMTSRSEYRLLLRQDNADERLTPHGRRVGLISDDRWERFCAKRAEITAEKARLEATLVDAATLRAFFEAHGLPAVTGLHLADLLRRPEFDYEDIAELDRERPALSARVRLSAQCDVKYAGYVKRQLSEVNRQKRLEELRLPENIDYAEVRGLRIEARQKLSAIRPVTLGQASRISGVSPADISVLLIWLGLKK